MTCSCPQPQARKGPPRPVIPYHLHQEGKRKLAESLMKQQQKNLSGSEIPANVLRMLTTPPDTPHSTQPPDDQAEKASLDSRGSTEASTSVSSGDVATGNLVDISVTPGMVRGLLSSLLIAFFPSLSLPNFCYLYPPLPLPLFCIS